MPKRKKLMTLKDLHKLMRKYRKMGKKPYIKGKGSGYVKIMFEN